jgi:hypothetical protein
MNASIKRREFIRCVEESHEDQEIALGAYRLCLISSGLRGRLHGLLDGAREDLTWMPAR